MKEKICSRCKILKTFNEFHFDKNSKTGVRPDCKECISKQNKNKKRKKITITCEICNISKEVDFYSNKRKKTNYCVNCASSILFKNKNRPELSNENSPHWKGGEYISSDGYKMIKTNNRNSSNRSIYKKEHILVYEKFLGREILTTKGYNGEQVHHIDGDKLNNSIENLFLCNNTSDHKKLHHQLQTISYQLIQLGIIDFNKETGKYFINESRIN